MPIAIAHFRHTITDSFTFRRSPPENPLAARELGTGTVFRWDDVEQAQSRIEKSLDGGLVMRTSAGLQNEVGKENIAGDECHRCLLVSGHGPIDGGRVPHHTIQEIKHYGPP
jgi:hypothetical protein